MIIMNLTQLMKKCASLAGALTLAGAKLNAAEQAPILAPVPSPNLRDASFPLAPSGAGRLEANRKLALRHVIDELCAMSLYNPDGTPRSVPKDGYPRHEVARAPLPLRLEADQLERLKKSAPADLQKRSEALFSRITNGVVNRYWLLDVYGRFLVDYAETLLPNDAHRPRTLIPLGGIPQYGCQLSDGSDTAENDRVLSQVAQGQTKVFREMFLKELAQQFSAAATSSAAPDSELRRSKVAVGGSALPVTPLREALSRTDQKLDSLRRSALYRLFNQAPQIEAQFYAAYDRINQTFAQGPLQPVLFVGEAPKPLEE